MKRTFIQLVKLFEEHSLIESNYTIISDGKVYHTDQLTSNNISEGFIVYEKLSEMLVCFRLLWGMTTYQIDGIFLEEPTY